jgi:enamine deaminase RidA (YjgF/YER057c/UK114 family)
MEAVVGFSRAVRVGPYISVGGTAPVGADGKTIGIGDVAAQTRQCIEIIKAALEQAGSGLHDVVRTRIILTDIENRKVAIDVRKEYFRDVRPVDTIMAVTRFVNPEWLIEVEALRSIQLGATNGSPLLDHPVGDGRPPSCLN